jgi:Lanthionine synthetase C-like protein
MAKGDDASGESSWRRILSGATAERALEAVDAIAESITSDTSLPGERDPSLGKGQAGLALLYAWLARTRRMPQADVLAWQCLDEAIEAVSTQAMNASLYGGFSGVAWATELVDLLLDPDAEDRNEAIDDALLRLLSRADDSPAPLRPRRGRHRSRRIRPAAVPAPRCDRMPPPSRRAAARACAAR